MFRRKGGGKLFLNQTIAGATFVREAGALKVRPDLDRLLGQFPLDVVNQDLKQKRKNYRYTITFSHLDCARSAISAGSPP